MGCHTTVTPCQLPSNVISSDKTANCHMTLLLIACVGNSIRVMCLHQLFRNPAYIRYRGFSLGNKMYGILSDVTASQIPLVHNYPQLFSAARLFHVPSTIEKLNKALDLWIPHTDHVRRNYGTNGN